MPSLMMGKEGKQDEMIEIGRGVVQVRQRRMYLNNALRSPDVVMYVAASFAHTALHNKFGARFDLSRLPPGGFESLPGFADHFRHCEIAPQDKKDPRKILQKIIACIIDTCISNNKYTQKEIIIVLGGGMKKTFSDCLAEMTRDEECGSLHIRILDTGDDPARDLMAIRMAEAYPFRGQGARVVFFVVPNKDAILSRKYGANEMVTDHYIALTRTQDLCVIVGTKEDWIFVMNPDKSDLLRSRHVSPKTNKTAIT